eukprot:TRINITY_DN78701_c0_g1_i1.p1 TRINITY_DN78701_c0_g1~~TRINITY_DN78701_c0_g1_i1.p1  ORF type:complete len:353 (+),score=47.63 TRINITY_DN78701_c0_g1_i1:119-1060(+)
MSDEEVTMVAQVINDIVDMEHFNEEQEQEIFEFTTCRTIECIAQALPNELIKAIGTNQNIPTGITSMLEERLIELVRRELFLPFLDGQDFKRIVRCIVVLLMSGLRKGGHCIEAMDEEERRTLVCSVFMKGVLDMFYDAEERIKLSNTITSMIKNIPFMPTPILDHISQQVIIEVGEEVERALVIVFEEYENAAKHKQNLPLLPFGLNRKPKEEEWMAHKRSPFTMQLRRRTCELMNKRIKENHPVLYMLPAASRTEWLLWCIDAIFTSIKTDKLEAAMENIIRLHGGFPSREDAEAYMEAPVADNILEHPAL